MEKVEWGSDSWAKLSPMGRETLNQKERYVLVLPESWRRTSSIGKRGWSHGAHFWLSRHVDFNTTRVHNYIRSTKVTAQACNVLEILFHRQVLSSRNLFPKPVANNIRKAANKCSVCRSNSPTTECPLASLPVKTLQRELLKAGFLSGYSRHGMLLQHPQSSEPIAFCLMVPCSNATSFSGT